MAANLEVPEWYRGPSDPSGYRVAVSQDLRRMRGLTRPRLTMSAMAKAVGGQLHRRIPESSVARWESGTKLPGADVYRAYIILSGVRLPGDPTGAAPDERMAALDARLRRIELERGIEGPDDFDDPISTTNAAKLVNVTRQTIHNWAREGTVRSMRQGILLLVSRADALARAGRLQDRS